MRPRSSTLSRSCVSTIARPGVVAGVDVATARLVVAAPRPADAAQVGAVGDARSSGTGTAVGAERIPQPQLGGGAAVEEARARRRRRRVRAWRSARAARWASGGRAAAGRSAASAWWNSSMTTMSKASAGMFVDAVRRQRLHAGEDVLPALRARRRRRTAHRSSRRRAPPGRCAATAPGSPGGGPRRAATGARRACARTAAGSPARR